MDWDKGGWSPDDHKSTGSEGTYYCDMQYTPNDPDTYDYAHYDVYYDGIVKYDGINYTVVSAKNGVCTIKQAQIIRSRHYYDCYLMSIFDDTNAKTLDVLRAYRDDVLSTFPEGRTVIRAYYALSPALISAIGDNERVATAVRTATVSFTGWLDRQ